MRTLATLALAALPWLAAQAGTPGAEAPRLTWYDAEGRAAWSRPLELAAGDGKATPLVIGPARSALPTLELDFLDGEQLSTDDYRGKVLLVDFWASWCGPCAESLPWLQAFHREMDEQGVELLTVNMKEPDDIARQFLWALNVDPPVARYSDAMDAALRISSLPTLLVVDQRGLIRSRIEAYGPGIYEKIRALTARLLEEDAPERPPVAQVVRGAGRIEALWAGPLPATVEGLATVETDKGPLVLGTARQEIFGFSADGEASLRKPTALGAERLRAIDGNDDAVAFGYRPVGTHVVRIPLADGRPQRIDTATHVLDIALDPGDDERPARLLLGTLDGIAIMDGEGRIEERREGAAVRQLAAGDGVVLLEKGGRLVRLDPGWEPLWQVEAGAEARRLIASSAGGGVGVAPGAVKVGVTGRFLEGDGEQVAVAIEGGLLLLDAADGRPLWAALWPEIHELAVADLDGDGRSELLVAARRRLVALGAVKPSP